MVQADALDYKRSATTAAAIEGVMRAVLMLDRRCWPGSEHLAAEPVQRAGVRGHWGIFQPFVAERHECATKTAAR
jgi:hypothetical protein